jgi:hypothetical protein
VIFRDPLFTEQRDRCLELCDEIQARGLNLTSRRRRGSTGSTPNCSTSSTRRIPCDELRRRIARSRDAQEVGPAADSAGASARGPRPLPRKGIVTAGFYVLGFLQDDWNSIAATIDYAPTSDRRSRSSRS